MPKRDNFLVELWQQVITVPDCEKLVSWTQGKYLVIHDVNGLMKLVYGLGLVRQKSYASFGRQLRIYRFNRTEDGMTKKGLQVWRHAFLTQTSKLSEVKKVTRNAPPKVRHAGRRRSGSASSTTSNVSASSDISSWGSNGEQEEIAIETNENHMEDPALGEVDGKAGSETDTDTDSASVMTGFQTLALSGSPGVATFEHLPTLGSSSPINTGNLPALYANPDYTFDNSLHPFESNISSPLQLDNWQYQGGPAFETWSSEALDTINESSAEILDWSMWGAEETAEVSPVGWW